MGSGADQRYNMSAIVKNAHEIGIFPRQQQPYKRYISNQITRKPIYRRHAQLSTLRLGLYQLQPSPR